jgi:hypothetical protein
MKHKTPVAARPGAASGNAIKRNPFQTPQQPGSASRSSGSHGDYARSDRRRHEQWCFFARRIL